MSQSDSTIPESFSVESNKVNHHRSIELPDVASDEKASITGRLNRVGMSAIEVLVKFANEGQTEICVPGYADAFVDLIEPATKGIHMSRLLLGLQEALDSQPVSPKLFKDLLNKMVTSHKEVSSSAFTAVSFDHSVRQESLKSGKSAWRHYPVRIEANIESGKIKFRLHLKVTYSSTCPCSAALSRQLLQAKFEEDFRLDQVVNVENVSQWLNENGSLATPHSQRSHADVIVELSDTIDEFPISEMISVVENALATPVQAAVKRIDEQEFARLNGSNLMFCEDAARRVRACLDECEGVRDFRVQVNHLESLHAHDAVAVVTKGIQGGMRP